MSAEENVLIILHQLKFISAELKHGGCHNKIGKSSAVDDLSILY